MKRKKVVELKAGSLMLAKGTLIHRGGANTYSKPRLIGLLNTVLVG